MENSYLSPDQDPKAHRARINAMRREVAELEAQLAPDPATDANSLPAHADAPR